MGSAGELNKKALLEQIELSRGTAELPSARQLGRMKKSELVTVLEGLRAPPRARRADNVAPAASQDADYEYEYDEYEGRPTRVHVTTVPVPVAPSGATMALAKQLAEMLVLFSGALEGLSQKMKPGGYELRGVQQSLAEPETRYALESTVHDIVLEESSVNPEWVGELNSPWTRLMMVMGAVAVKSVRHAEPDVQDAPEGAQST